jgi:hypothetical protein
MHAEHYNVIQIFSLEVHIEKHHLGGEGLALGLHCYSDGI